MFSAVLLGTVNCLVFQTLQSPVLWSSIESITKSTTKMALDSYLQMRMLRFADSILRMGSFYQLLGVATFVVALLSLGLLLWRKSRSPNSDNDETGNLRKYQELRILKYHHETAAMLSDLVDKDGAGAWPPKASHDSMPAALKPYKEIYLECAPLLPAADPSLEDDVNQQRRNRYRSRMFQLLHERVDIAEVEMIMKAVEAGDWSVCPRDTYNAVYCCVAVCRHAYR